MNSIFVGIFYIYIIIKILLLEFLHLSLKFTFVSMIKARYKGWHMKSGVSGVDKY